MIPALAAFARSNELNGKSLQWAMQKLMQIWLSLCIKQVKKGDRAKVENYLLTKVQEIKGPSASSQLKPGATKTAVKRAAKIDKFTGTRVAIILRKFNIYGARFIRNAGRFAQLCQRYLSRRKAGVNVHRASLIDPFRKLKGRGASDSAKVKVSPHEMIERAKADFASIAVDAWGSARKTPQNRRPKGMKGVAGRVFHKTMGALERATIVYMLKQNLLPAAMKAGFRAKLEA